MNIGLLTYLGQGSVETQQSKPWYFKDRDQDKETEDASSKSMGRLGPSVATRSSVLQVLDLMYMTYLLIANNMI